MNVICASNETHRIHDIDGDKGTDAVADIISTVVEGGKASSAHLDNIGI